MTTEPDEVAMPNTEPDGERNPEPNAASTQHAPAAAVLPETRRRRLRVSRRGLVAVAAAPFVLVGAAAVLAYASTDVPSPSSIALPQISVISYADGGEIGRVGAENRVEVPLAQVSDAAQKAVLAAENRDYYSEPGISFKGIGRAFWVNLHGNASQGGSTITQQYAKNVFLSRDKTLRRKAREALLAVKLDRKYSKDEILGYYLNTVYFGRGAYGIESAAQVYFGKKAAALDASEGAVLAALLRSPSGYDPARNPKDARARWEYVIDGMRSEGWLKGNATYPAVRPRRQSDAQAGPQGYLVQQVLDELEKNGISESEVASGGLRISTTIDRRAQAAAVRAVREMGGATAPAGLHRALVAVEPGTGRIRAEYAGDDYVKRPFNDVTQGIAQAGSSFKPFVLAAALDSGMSLKLQMDGKSPQTFGNYEVRNFGPGAGEQFPMIDLVKATAHSVNTVFVPLGQQVGLPQVAGTATRLGVTADMTKDSRYPSLSLGVTAVHPIDQATAYATLAARGVHADPFIVQQVTNARRHLIYRAKRQTANALPQSVADDTTYALQHVVTEGTGRAAQLTGRPAAGKTGTTSGNTAAWFVGYTPQLATAVALFSDRQNVPLRGIAGVDEVTGGSLPARAWHDFMTAATKGMPVEQFAPPVYGGNAPSPSPSPSPSASPSPTPSASPSAAGEVLPSSATQPGYDYAPPSPDASYGYPEQEPGAGPSPDPYTAPSPDSYQASPDPYASPSGTSAKKGGAPTPTP
ncbi:MAG: transglycosylase domain-containing protein [Mycobacteriales bacterium]